MLSIVLLFLQFAVSGQSREVVPHSPTQTPRNQAGNTSQPTNDQQAETKDSSGEQDDQIVTLTVIASGKTESEATMEALRSALTQTSSVFISSNTTLINDDLMKDEISMINNGSVADYQIIDKTNTDDGIIITCNVTVSVNKLSSFVERSGGTTELKGGLFASNIKLLELNKRAEEKVIQDLIVVSREILKTSFDYEIINGSPIMNGGNWAVSLEIKIKKNGNYENFVNYFSNTLKSISLQANEVESYISLNLPVFSIGLFDNSNLREPTPVIHIITVSAEESDFPPNKGDYLYWTKHSNSDTFRIYDYNGLWGMLKRVKKELKNLGSYNTVRPDNDKYTVYATSSETKYNHILLRSNESYNSLASFLVTLPRFIQENVVVENNVRAEMNLTDMTCSYNDYRYSPENNRNDYNIYEIKTYLPILFAGDAGTKSFYYVLDDFRYRIIERQLAQHPYIRAVANVSVVMPQYSYYGYNYIIQQSRSYTRYSGYIDNRLFELFFGSYIKYQADFESLQRKNAQIVGFPLQLSLIGNNEDVVLEMKLHNILSLDEISRVTGYSISRTD